MTKFLPIILLIIPIIACAISSLQKRNLFLRLIEIALPVLFFASLTGLYRQVHNDIAIPWLHLDQTILVSLFLLNFLWLVFGFYSQRFWQLSSEEKPHQFRMFFTFIVAFLIMIFVSKNLMITLFFYSCLLLSAQLFVVRFLRHTEVGFLRLFTFLLYFESFFFFLALVATYKFTGGIDFAKGGVIKETLSYEKQVFLFILYFLGLFFSVLMPYFLFFRRPNIEPIITYIFFFIAYSFGSICIFLKLINAVFGVGVFAKIFAGFNFHFIELIFLFNVIATSALILISRGIKISFFYLFFQQFFILIFSTIFLAVYRGSEIYLSLISFSLSFTLVFFCISNLTLYLSKSGENDLAGLFYKLPINVILLIFAILSMSGVMPTIGAVDKFLLLKIIWQKHLGLSAAILFINLATLLIFAVKMLIYFFSRNEEDEESLAIARDIDFDSSLILTALSISLLMFIGLFITKIT